MPAKKVSIGTKPQAEKPIDLNQWVETRKEPPAIAEEKVEASMTPAVVKMKRLTLDIPEPLHRAIKHRAVEEGVAMADLLRELLEKHYGSDKETQK